jgi:hypothetical protein
MQTGNQFLTIASICGRLPGAKGAPHISPSTVTRWILVGCPAQSGGRVKLAATRAGGRWLVKESDLEEFFSALAGDATRSLQPPSGSRWKSINHAVKQLEAAGA